MRKFGRFIGLTVILTLVLTATAAWAQPGMGPGRGQGRGWGAGDPYSRMYNSKTVETLSGEVVSVDKFTPGRKMSYGVHFTLKTEKETIPVHLGPSWYMEKQGVTIAQGDKVEVTDVLLFQERRFLAAATGPGEGQHQADRYHHGPKLGLPHRPPLGFI